MYDADDLNDNIVELKETIYCCSEHVDMAIDEFLVDVEDAPEIILCDKKSMNKCCFCNKRAIYEITNKVASEL